MPTKTQERILKLLKRFNSGDTICIEALKYDSLYKELSESTIRRAIGAIKKVFPDSIELIRGAKGEKSCYKAITKDMFSNLADNDTLVLLTQTFNIAKKNGIFDNLNISENDRKIIETKIKKSNDCYKFISKPLENEKSDLKLLKEIERAINGNRYIELIHKERDCTKKCEVKPYKILFMQENFYLACENCNPTYPFTIFRLLNIESIKLSSKTFHKNYNIVDFIEQIQTPRPMYSENFKKNLINVKVEVASEKAHFFTMKDFLPSQKLIETKEDGGVVLTFKVTQELEVEELIKGWIPYIKVIKPLTLKKKIDDDLKMYLDTKECNEK